MNIITPRSVLRNVTLILAIFSLFFASTSSSRAANRTWDGTTGNWDVPTNWSGDTVPSDYDFAYINNGGTATLPTGVSGVYSELNLATGTTLSISGGRLEGNSSDGPYSSGSSYIASGARVIVTSGT